MNLKRKEEELCHDAICAKNEIARERRDSILDKREVSLTFIKFHLGNIEKFLAITGMDNQPCIDDILESHYRL